MNPELTTNASARSSRSSAGGSRWIATSQHENKQKRKSLKTASKKEARRRALLLEAEIIKGKFRDDAKPAAIDAAIKAYQKKLEIDKWAEKTRNKYARVFERVTDLARRLRRRTLVEIDLVFLDRYREERVQQDGASSNSTLIDEVVIIKQLMNFALSRGMIHANPVKGLRISKRKRRPQPCWSTEEVERILARAGEPHVWEYTILADTGFRIGELRHLTWDDVDFQNNLLHVREKRVSDREYWKPKDGDQRSVPMSPRVRALLERLPRHSTWVVTAPKSPKYPKGDARISLDRALRVLKRILRRLRLAGHLHTFRHSLISRALLNGVPEAVVREWDGHVDSNILKLYTHIASSASQQAMQKLSAVESVPTFSKDKEQ